MWWRVSALQVEVARLEERLDAAHATNADLRERLDRSEREFARLRDQVLAKEQVIRAPLRDEAAHQKPVTDALASVVKAMGVREINRERSDAEVAS